MDMDALKDRLRTQALDEGFVAMRICRPDAVPEVPERLRAFLDQGLDGVMIGRAAYHDPTTILAAADPQIFGTGEVADPVDVARRMIPYIETHLSCGGKLHQVTRHMLGLFSGRPGARRWRQVLSSEATRPGAGPEVIEAALEPVLSSAA